MFSLPPVRITAITGILFLLFLSLPAVYSNDCPILIDVDFYDGPFTLFIGDVPSQNLNYWYCSYKDPSATIEWYHNGTLLQEMTLPYVNSYTWSPIIDVNQTGTYSCVVTLPGQTEPCGNVSTFLYVIDQSHINVPSHQYAFANHSYTLMASSTVYPIDGISWSVNSSPVSNEFNSVQLSSDQLVYEANVTLMGVWRLFNTTLHVLISPVISTHPHPKELAFGPNITNYTITFINYSPGDPLVTWRRLRQDGHYMTSNRVITSHSTYGGTSTLQVSRRGESGSYRVTVESTFNGLPVPYDIMETTRAEYSFSIDVIVFPAFPVVSISSGSFNSTVSWTHTNLTTDDAPQSIKLILLQSLVQVTMINISINTSGSNSHTFDQLIPATSYTVRTMVANEDRVSTLPSTVDFTTATAAPHIQSLSAVRTNSTTFNLTLQFLYYGAPNITSISIGYKPVNKHTIGFVYIPVSTPVWISRENLTLSSLITINNDSMIVRERIEWMVHVTNSADKSNISNIVQERIDPLGPTSSVSFSYVTAHSVTLSLRLPIIGTPPILTLTLFFTSSRENHTLTLTGLYQLGEELTININESTIRGGEGLHSGTRYTVWAVAGNLMGNSSKTSNRVSFVTVIEEPLPSSTVLSSQSIFPLWAICLVGVVPGLICVLIIVTLIMITVCTKRRKVTKNGYPITSSSEKPEPYRQSEGSVGIQKYFSTPLVPRAPTAEPIDLTAPLDITIPLDGTSYQSAQEDSDSDITQNLSPKYKYVVSPTPSEVGVKGYVGSEPGSGTYVYV